MKLIDRPAEAEHRRRDRLRRAGLERSGALPRDRLLPRAGRLLRGHDRTRSSWPGCSASTAIPERRSRDRAARALDIVELTEDKDRLIRGYSRGMRQRIKFAQAIAHDPEIIILDEPLSGLDPLGKRKLIRLIKDYRDQGRTILVSSHVLPEIEALTSEVVLIHQGQGPGPGRHPLHPRAHRVPPAPDLGPVGRPAGPGRPVRRRPRPSRR